MTDIYGWLTERFDTADLKRRRGPTGGAIGGAVLDEQRSCTLCAQPIERPAQVGRPTGDESRYRHRQRQHVVRRVGAPAAVCRYRLPPTPSPHARCSR